MFFWKLSKSNFDHSIKYFLVSHLNDDWDNFKLQEGLNHKKKGVKLMFRPLKDLHETYNKKGFWIREVTIPDDVEPSYNPKLNIYLTRKAILGPKENLYSIETVQKYNIPITSDYIAKVSELGLIDLLDWWKKNYPSLEYEKNAIDQVSEAGYNTEVLDWWKNSELPLKYSAEAIDKASLNGFLDILEWWKNSNLLLKYTSKTIDYLAENQNEIEAIKIMNWWKNSGLEMKYTEKALETATKKNYIELLNWWKDSGLKLKYNSFVITTAYNQQRYCRSPALEWWKNSDLEFKFTPDDIINIFKIKLELYKLEDAFEFHKMIH